MGVCAVIMTAVEVMVNKEQSHLSTKPTSKTLFSTYATFRVWNAAFIYLGSWNKKLGMTESNASCSCTISLLLQGAAILDYKLRVTEAPQSFWVGALTSGEVSDYEPQRPIFNEKTELDVLSFLCNLDDNEPQHWYWKGSMHQLRNLCSNVQY